MSDFEGFNFEEEDIKPSSGLKRKTMGYLLSMKAFYSVLDLFLVKAGSTFIRTIHPDDKSEEE